MLRSFYVGWVVYEKNVKVHLKVYFTDADQTGPGVHPASYAMGSGGSFPGGKAALA
jgi:hypothetical protein